MSNKQGLSPRAFQHTRFNLKKRSPRIYVPIADQILDPLPPNVLND